MKPSEALDLDARRQILRRQMLDALLVLADMDEEPCIHKLADKALAEEALSRCLGNQKKAAALLGISARVMHYKVHKDGLPYVSRGTQLKWGRAAR